jgi:hypothetical protein
MVGSTRLSMRVIAPITPLSSDAVSGIVRRACQRAGLPPAGAHGLRHASRRKGRHIPMMVRDPGGRFVGGRAGGEPGILTKGGRGLAGEESAVG